MNKVSIFVLSVCLCTSFANAATGDRGGSLRVTSTPSSSTSSASSSNTATALRNIVTKGSGTTSSDKSTESSADTVIATGSGYVDQSRVGSNRYGLVNPRSVTDKPTNSATDEVIENLQDRIDTLQDQIATKADVSTVAEVDAKFDDYAKTADVVAIQQQANEALVNTFAKKDEVETQLENRTISLREEIADAKSKAIADAKTKVDAAATDLTSRIANAKTEAVSAADANVLDKLRSYATVTDVLNAKEGLAEKITTDALVAQGFITGTELNSRNFVNGDMFSQYRESINNTFEPKVNWTQREQNVDNKISSLDNKFEPKVDWTQREQNINDKFSRFGEDIGNRFEPKVDWEGRGLVTDSDLGGLRDRLDGHDSKFEEWLTRINDNKGRLDGHDSKFTDWLEKINENKGRLDGHDTKFGEYLKTTNLKDRIKGLLDENDTESLLEKLKGKGFLTQHQSLADYLKNDSNLKDILKGKGFLTEHQSLANYLKNDSNLKDILKGKGFLTEHQSLAEYLKTGNLKGHIKTLLDETDDESLLAKFKGKGFLTKTDDLPDYVKITNLKTNIKNLLDDTASDSLTSKLDGRYTRGTIPTKLSELTDDLNFLKNDNNLKGILRDKLDDIYAQGNLSEYLKTSGLRGGIKTLLNETGDESLLTALKGKGFLTSTDGVLDGYLKNDNNLQGILRGKLDDVYALGSRIPTKLSELQNDKGFLSSTDGINLTDYPKWSELSKSKLMEIIDNGYITNHQSLNAYLKSEDLETSVKGLLEETGNDTFLTRLKGKGFLKNDDDLTATLQSKLDNIYAARGSIPTKLSQLTNENNEFVTETSLSGKGFLTQNALLDNGNGGNYSSIDALIQARVAAALNDPTSALSSTFTSKVNSLADSAITASISEGGSFINALSSSSLLKRSLKTALSD